MVKPSQMFAVLKKKVVGLEGYTIAVTRRALTLGSRDSWCGWRAVTWATSSVDMVILSRGSQAMTLIPGVYTRHDAIGLTSSSAVVPGDQILDTLSRYWQVESTRTITTGPGLNIVYYACDLSYPRPWQTDFGATTWSKTRGSDPRYRTKYFIDNKARVAQITKDNDSTQAVWAAIFNNPPYPFRREFETATVVNGLYVIDEPNSTPLVGCNHTTYGYVEHVPVHVCTVNTTGCSGEALLWKMIAELRYICETYPTGSLRLLAGERKEDRDLGQGLWLYDRVFTIEYTRDTIT